MPGAVQPERVRVPGLNRCSRGQRPRQCGSTAAEGRGQLAGDREFDAFVAGVNSREVRRRAGDRPAIAYSLHSRQPRYEAVALTRPADRPGWCALCTTTSTGRARPVRSHRRSRRTEGARPQLRRLTVKASSCVSSVRRLRSWTPSHERADPFVVPGRPEAAPSTEGLAACRSGSSSGSRRHTSLLPADAEHPRPRIDCVSTCTGSRMRCHSTSAAKPFTSRRAYDLVEPIVRAAGRPG